jgi:hypothetical protein
MRIEKNGLSIESIDDWWRIAPPKDPVRHWVDGRSAKETAKAWLARAPQSPPSEIERLLSSRTDLEGLVIEYVEPEARLPFDGRSSPRNADLAIIARDARGIVAITVESKADEVLDELVATVFKEAIERLIESPRSGGVARIAEVAQSILPPRVPGTPAVAELRYQLLTAVAGTLAHAVALDTDRAIVVIHEFQTTRTSSRKLADNAADIDRFVARLSQGSVQEIVPGRLVGPFVVAGEPLFARPFSLYIGKAIRQIGVPGA